MISRVFCYVQRSFVSSVFERLFFFAHTHFFEHGREFHSSGLSVQEQFWGTLSSKFGPAACPVPRAMRAWAVCNAILIFVSNKSSRLSN